MKSDGAGSEPLADGHRFGFDFCHARNVLVVDNKHTEHTFQTQMSEDREYKLEEDVPASYLGWQAAMETRLAQAPDPDKVIVVVDAESRGCCGFTDFTKKKCFLDQARVFWGPPLSPKQMHSVAKRHAHTGVFIFDPPFAVTPADQSKIFAMARKLKEGLVDFKGDVALLGACHVVVLLHREPAVKLKASEFERVDITAADIATFHAFIKPPRYLGIGEQFYLRHEQCQREGCICTQNCNDPRVKLGNPIQR